jgi:hypothetical protein
MNATILSSKGSSSASKKIPTALLGNWIAVSFFRTPFINIWFELGGRGWESLDWNFTSDLETTTALSSQFYYY